MGVQPVKECNFHGSKGARKWRRGDAETGSEREGGDWCEKQCGDWCERQGRDWCERQGGDLSGDAETGGMGLLSNSGLGNKPGLGAAQVPPGRHLQPRQLPSFLLERRNLV